MSRGPMTHSCNWQLLMTAAIHFQPAVKRPPWPAAVAGSCQPQLWKSPNISLLLRHTPLADMIKRPAAKQRCGCRGKFSKFQSGYTVYIRLIISSKYTLLRKQKSSYNKLGSWLIMNSWEMSPYGLTWFQFQCMKTSLLLRLQVQTLPNATSPISKIFPFRKTSLVF